ncbi:acyl-CoA-like ligand-binding transcription factor [Streptomyces sp. JW3]|uniref:acyl-CoA-like ligand-binding transcription factor n=1 Tax=Streptomyces sp. JW3 TaxID=3456955 RepID=UPI003FA47C33
MTTTRDIARAAVRNRLARVAVELFRREGFDKVTGGEVAAAAGVSRSTFLRYFRTKEEAVLSAFETNCDAAASTLRARPADEEEWAVLRHAMGAFLQPYYEDKEDSLALARLINDSAALRARRLEMMFHWRNVLADILAERAGRPEGAAVRFLVLTAAALDCLNVAVEQWTASGGQQGLTAILDQAFAALTPRRGGAG